MHLKEDFCYSKISTNQYHTMLSLSIFSLIDSLSICLLNFFYHAPVWFERSTSKGQDMNPFENVFKRPSISRLTFAQGGSVEEKWRRHSKEEEEEEEEEEANGKWQKMASDKMTAKKQSPLRKDKAKKKKVKVEQMHLSVLEKIFAFLDWSDSSQKYNPLVPQETSVDMSSVNVAYCRDWRIFIFSTLFSRWMS